MNRNLLCWVLACILMIPLGLEAGNTSLGKDGYKIEITVEGLNATQASLAHYYYDNQYIDDTVEVVNGSFVFEGDEPLEEGMYLIFFPPENDYFELIIGADQHFSLSTKKGDYVKHMKVKGSKEAELYYSDLTYMTNQRLLADSLQSRLKNGAEAEEAKMLQERLNQIGDQVEAYREKFLKENDDFFYTKMIYASQDPSIPVAPRDENGKLLDSLFAFKYYKAHYFDTFDFNDPRLLRTPVMHHKVSTYMEKLSYRHLADSMMQSIDYLLENFQNNEDVFRFLTARFLNQFAKPKYMVDEAIYCHIVDKYYVSGQAHWMADSLIDKMKERCEKISPTLPGRIAPDFKVMGMDGKYKRLHNIEADWVAIYFWNYDCSHCKKVTPKLVEAFEKYKLEEKGVKVLTININGDVEEWKEKIQTYGLDIEGVINTEDIYRQSGSTEVYDIYSTPRLFLLDKKKAIKAKQISVPQLLMILGTEMGFEVDEEDRIEEKEEDE
ncbi:MAG: thioredoxin-like domain-containing protein [Bacteroidota bacterium]